MAAKEIKAIVIADRTPNWVNFMATLFLLIGLFFAARTVVNLVAFPKYPIAPSTGLSSLIGTPGGYDESSCMGQEACLNSLKEIRNQSLIIDVTNSAFFLFLGAGILYSRKRLYN